ncbi:hypothetical protein IF1G_10224 [Cordyceps javanica]|uniref:Uncharacterized protein n=1 Tax=Cordyceps javanica TaxID=43265 RepID=A0A545UNF3_9HYPO|nr:hypothetical protein IF1G_10224 [Cordyceps javanica]TQW02734.1 hypothetical protein IF2G_09616 [Cordyceps javanica]
MNNFTSFDGVTGHVMMRRRAFAGARFAAWFIIMIGLFFFFVGLLFVLRRFSPQNGENARPDSHELQSRTGADALEAGTMPARPTSAPAAHQRAGVLEPGMPPDRPLSAPPARRNVRIATAGDMAGRPAPTGLAPQDGLHRRSPSPFANI